MNRTTLYFIIITTLILTSCKQQHQELTFTPPVFQNTTHLEGRVLVDTFVMGRCFNIDHYNNYLLVSAYRGDKELINFFDKNSGECIKSILRPGRGPGEALSLRDFDVDHSTGKVLFYDVMSKKLITFYIDSVIMSNDVKNHIYAKNYPIYMYKILQGNHCYIAEGGYKDNGKDIRLSIIYKDSTIYKYYKFPNVKVSGTDENGIIPAYIHGSKLTISPNKKQIAYATSYGAILEIFDVDSNQIKLNTIKGYYRPTYTLEKNNIKTIPGETIWGFIDLYAVNNYIYAIFSGSTDSKDTKNIGVFDWKGNPVKLYTTDYRLEKICVDEKKNKIYAHGTDKDLETVIVEFSL